jgi:hypothetical protein
MDTVLKRLQTEVKSYDLKTRTIHLIASTESTDRDGDVIDAAGWRLETFLGHPVIMFAHDYSQLPVGMAKNVSLKDRKLEMDVVLSDTTQAEEISKYLSGGFPLACSVGFTPLKCEPIYSKAAGAAGAYPERTGMHYMEQSLNEVSLCALGSNTDAMVQILSFGLSNQKLQKDIDELISILKDRDLSPGSGVRTITKEMEAELADRFKTLEDRIIAVEASVVLLEKGLKESLAEKEPEQIASEGPKPEPSKDAPPPAPPEKVMAKIVPLSPEMVARLTRQEMERQIKRAKGAIQGGSV